MNNNILIILKSESIFPIPIKSSWDTDVDSLDI